MIKIATITFQGGKKHRNRKQKEQSTQHAFIGFLGKIRKVYDLK